jgi:hypothetical protein
MGALSNAVSARCECCSGCGWTRVAWRKLWSWGLTERLGRGVVGVFLGGLWVMSSWSRSRISSPTPSPGSGYPVNRLSTEMSPFTEEELERAYRGWRAPPRRAARTRGDRDAVERSARRPPEYEDPDARAHPRASDPSSSTRGRRREVHQGAAIPSRSARQRVLPLVLAMADGKEPGDLLFTTDGGSPLHRTATLRAVDSPKTNPGRRIHDLRHTAACLWLAGGVDPGAVQAWMGHESIATRTCTCTSSAHVPTEPVWRDSTCPGGRRGPSQSPIGGLPR